MLATLVDACGDLGSVGGAWGPAWGIGVEAHGGVCSWGSWEEAHEGLAGTVVGPLQGQLEGLVSFGFGFLFFIFFSTPSMLVHTAPHHRPALNSHLPAWLGLGR
ncbi:unnamed protein product [Natator depressus]